MRIAIIGASGQLGTYLCKKIEGVTQLTRSNIDILDRHDIKEKLWAFDVVINCSAFTNTKAAETDKNNFLVNYNSVKNMYNFCKKSNKFFIHISSLSVFEPTLEYMNKEMDFLNGKPKTKYGIAKWKADKFLNKKGGNFLVIRPSWLHSSGRQNFITKLNILNRSEYSIVSDDIGQFTSGKMILDVILRSFKDEKMRGFINVSSTEVVSRYSLYEIYCKLSHRNVTLNKVNSNDINFDLSKINYQFMDVTKYNSIFGQKKLVDLIKDWIEEEEWKQ